jgi:hypothetical protein
MSKIRDFNSTVVDLLNDLASALPSFTDLTIVATLASGMLRLDPNNTTVLDTFYPTVVEHASLIDNRDELTTLHLLKSLLPSQYMTSVDAVWEKLTPENKSTVWDYIDTLRQQAQATVEKTESESEADLDKIPEDSELFVVYKSVWKEFVLLLQEHCPDMSELWEQSLATLATLKPSELHTSVKTALSPTLQTVKTSRDVLNVILPKDEKYMRKEIEVDIERLAEDVPFSLSPSTSFQQFVHIVNSVASVSEVPVYWHYTKVLTSVLGDCPPEMVGLLVSSCSAIVGSGSGSAAEE